MATSQAATPLSAAEQTTLQFMHEEEKLAKDVYLTLYDKWQLPVFSNIAQAEQRHSDRLKSLLDQYGLAASVQSDEVGVFNNPELAKLYAELTTQGAKSIQDALLVGGLVEEIDILDLRKAVAESDQDNVDQTYNNLLRGSRNHLRAFTRQYEQRSGLDYEAQRMTQTDVDAIMESEQERGGGHGQGKGQGRGQGKGHGQGMGHGQGKGYGQGMGHS